MKIESLLIYCKNFDEQKKFYGEVLKLAVREISEKEFHVQIGYTVLKILRHKDFKPYHLAFHISAGMEKQALEWLKNKVKILKPEKNEIIDFPNWKAKSIYFYDADKNIVEFIARKDFNHSESNEFSSDEIHGVAEIGLAVDDVKSTYQHIRNHSTLVQYFGDQEKFCVIGTDRGLIICVDKNTKTWFPTQNPSENAAFQMKFSHNEEIFQFKYDGKQVQVHGIL